MNNKKYHRILQSLADWLLSDSVSWSKLDSFRKQLGYSPEAFARLLGKSPNSLSIWRKKGVPRQQHTRHQMHEAVWLLSHVNNDVVNRQMEAELEGLRPHFLHQNGSIPARDEASFFIPLSGHALTVAKSSHKANFYAEIREKHRTDSPCQCYVCEPKEMT